MAVHNIYVSLKGDGPHLNFTEDQQTAEGLNFETVVNPGDTLVWQLAENSRLHSLVGVRIYDGAAGGTEMMRDVKVEGGKIEATIYTPKNVNHGEIHESYLVQYKKDAEGPMIEEDPKLKMRGGS